ncbi:DUF2520 domain-containing protein [Arenibacter sp. TNZ]|jgi:predicted short-subunit dehydrogenase-like oxidoreductase (DUF2520 family)|uniref:Rossmann-like and DUF2520 domain-containing protein n=1 Tax=Arenibacter TaxID=178469 RepID=UPI000CD3C952|nr:MULTISPECIES: DUF2520 domain-containing protein [Arenibacter]MCM4172108.1 DUF2520 domain-containing protein [Arenibacter sp. TNZ]
MIRVVILGTGNVAKHLFDTFWNIEDINVLQVLGRNKHKLSYFKDKASTSTDYSKMVDADIFLIAVSDDAIAEVAQFLNPKKGIIVHTSGSVPLGALGNQLRKGVFYPLQSFSEGKPIDFKSVPICIEAENEVDLELLLKLAHFISSKVYEISSDQRKSIHLAAVFANNFTNHLFTIASEICADNDLPFHILTPLIKETVQKLDYLPPFDAQTGPAKRNDTKTIENHLNQLKNKNYKDIYSLLSKSIREKYGQEL